MHWRLKGAIQKFLGHVPLGDHLHYVLQRRAGGLRHFERELDAKLEDWRLMIGHLRTVGIDPAGARFVEVGTGWYPTFPLTLYLAGAARVSTFDLNRHVKPELTRRLVTVLGERLGFVAEAADRPVADVERAYRPLAEAIAAGAPLDAATDAVVAYRAPGDASVTGLPAGSVDVVFSNSVLEHVPAPAIERCLAEAMRVLRPGGVVFHSVNCGDHYAYADPAIDQLNYLRYSDAAWRKWNNAFLYQNRLRAADFTAMARAAGFTIEVDTSRPHPERLRQLARTPVHPDFGHYDRDQLAITSIDFVGRKPASR
ncbi:MAG: class I SAM-dependent methyltransferase [Kofleriaceae bacterium]|nr:class I SAM-dependent methyltransferase [Kofleriaceae bacterium]MCL4225342.1 methyltransferase domain-containing protein [Myxococcales bacterium]